MSKRESLCMAAHEMAWAVANETGHPAGYLLCDRDTAARLRAEVIARGTLIEEERGASRQWVVSGMLVVVDPFVERRFRALPDLRIAAHCLLEPGAMEQWGR